MYIKKREKKKEQWSIMFFLLLFLILFQDRKTFNVFHVSFGGLFFGLMKQINEVEKEIDGKIFNILMTIAILKIKVSST